MDTRYSYIYMTHPDLHIRITEMFKWKKMDFLETRNYGD